MRRFPAILLAAAAVMAQDSSITSYTDGSAASTAAPSSTTATNTSSVPVTHTVAVAQVRMKELSSSVVLFLSAGMH